MGPRYWMLLGVLAVLVAAPGSAGQAGVPTLDQLVLEAISANPEIEASETRWRMFADRVRQVGTLEEPMVRRGVIGARTTSKRYAWQSSSTRTSGSSRAK